MYRISILNRVCIVYFVCGVVDQMYHQKLQLIRSKLKIIGNAKLKRNKLMSKNILDIYSVNNKISCSALILNECLVSRNHLKFELI